MSVEKKQWEEKDNGHVEECTQACLGDAPPIEHTQKLIDRLPKIMNAIIEVEGERTSY